MFKRALSVLRGALFLLVVLIGGNGALAQSAETLLIRYAAQKMALGLSEIDALALLNSVYNGSAGGDLVSSAFRIGTQNVQLKIELPGNSLLLKPFIEMKCEIQPDMASLCKFWTTSSEFYKKTVADQAVLPPLVTGLNEYNLVGACALSNNALGLSADSTPFRADFKQFAKYGTGYETNILKNGIKIKGTGINTGDLSRSFHALYASHCLTYDFMTFLSDEGLSDASIAAHVRYSLLVWLQNQSTPLQVLSIFKPGLGYSFPDDAVCTPELCPDLPENGGGAPGAAGPSVPPCTRPDGSTSGNPYDCAPTDTETNCTLIDIPCNFKKLLIPRKEFLSDKLKDGVGLTVKFPLTVADSWMTSITFAGHTFPVGADFSTLTWNEETKDQFRFFAWWSTFLFLLGYLGVPFMGGKRGMADSAKDATVGAAAREAAENDRAEAAYRSLRADDSWKNP